MEIQPPQTLGSSGRIAGIGLVCALLVLPWVADSFTVILARDIMVLALFAAGLHFMMGIGGLISFGHAAFFGLGAYAAALMVSRFGFSMSAALLAAPVAAAAGAVLIGWFAVRLSGVYLAMLTLAAAQILWSAGTQWQDVTGGDDGLIGIWPAAWASGTTAFYYLTLILCGIGISALFSLGGHRFGMLLRAGRDAPARAEALGINVRRRQWAAIIIAGTSAGLAGGIFAFSKGSVFPDTLSIPRSVDALVMVLLGGLHAPAGSILGAGVFTLLDDLLSRLPYWRALLGLAVVAIAMFAPGGIGGAWAQFIRRKKAASA